MTGRGRPEHVISDEEKHKISAARSPVRTALTLCPFLFGFDDLARDDEPFEIASGENQRLISGVEGLENDLSLIHI